MGKIYKEIEKTFSYWGVVFKELVLIFGAEMRTIIIGVAVALIIACISTVAFFAGRAQISWVDGTWNEVFYSLAGACVTGVLLLLPFLIAVAYLPAKIFESQQNEINKHQEERKLARAEQLRLKEINNNTWVGIEIHNNENKTFTGWLQIIDIAEYGALPNPLELFIYEDYIETIVIMTGLWKTISVATKSGNAISIGSPEKPILLGTGEYTIMTQLNGSFGQPGLLSERIRINSIQRKWKLKFIAREGIFELIPIHEEFT